MSTISNINQWIQASEPDYFMMFVKAWIPFNAWFMMNFWSEDEKRTSDRAIMDYMKDAKPGENRYKDRIMNLLTNNTSEAIAFRNHVAALHFELRSNPIPNLEEAISLSRVCITSNPTTSYTPVAIGEFTYSAQNDLNLPKTSPRWILQVLDSNSGDTNYMVCIRKPSLHELVHNEDFIALPQDKMREGLKEALNQVSPNRTESVVLKEYEGEVVDAPADSIIMGETKKVCLVSNRDKIARAIMQIIYELRCKLFHGELAPTSDYRGVYKYAYYIQKSLIKNLV